MSSPLVRGTVHLDSGAYTMAFDYASGTSPVYIGATTPGNPTSAATWQIKKLTYDGSNNLLSIAYANGSLAFDQVWDNRASLSYS